MSECQEKCQIKKLRRTPRTKAERSEGRATRSLRQPNVEHHKDAERSELASDSEPFPTTPPQYPHTAGPKCIV